MSSISKLTTNYYAADDTRYVFIDGRACTNLDACFAILQEQLSIPDYFGKNLDALEEVLADLEWIDEEKIKIIVSHADSLLRSDTVKKKIFLEILHTADNE